MARMLPALLVMLLLAACAGPRPSLYAPRDGRDGYAEEALGKGLFRVTFQGNHVTSRERAENYALYRAAELTLELGAERFAVHDRLTERHTKVTREYYDPYPYDPYWRYRPYYYRPLPHRFYDERTTYLAQITIEPFTGIAPRDVGRVYRAREVIERLAPQIERPEAKAP